MLNWLRRLIKSQSKSSAKPLKPPRSARRYEPPLRSEMLATDEMTDRLAKEWTVLWRIVNEGCREFGGSVLSGIRSEDRNVMVGGHPQSRHVLGLAADITFEPGDDANIRCNECFAWFYERGLHGYIRQTGTSLHIQDRSAKRPTGIGEN